MESLKFYFHQQAVANKGLLEFTLMLSCGYVHVDFHDGQQNKKCTIQSSAKITSKISDIFGRANRVTIDCNS